MDAQPRQLNQRRVTVQLLGRRQRLLLPPDTRPEALQQALSRAVAAEFEVQPPFSFSNDQGYALEDQELAVAVEAGSIIVAHLSDLALQELSRRVRQLRNLQWGLVSQQLEKVRVESAVPCLPGDSSTRRAEAMLHEQLAEFRLELKQTLAVRLDRLQMSMEQRLQALEESWEDRFGSALAQVKGRAGTAMEVPDGDADAAKEKNSDGLCADIEGLVAQLRGECGKMSASVQELREECREAIQREVRARLEHHRNLHEELKKEAQQRVQITDRLEREIRELAGTAPALPQQRTVAFQAAPRQAMTYFTEPVASPTSPYPASLRSELWAGSPASGSPSRLR